MEDLPFRAEYAKSGRASCRGCKDTITQGSLRLAVMVQSPMFDAKVPHWYHSECFFKKQRPKTADDISHFESLRWEDQEQIKKNIATFSGLVVPTKKGKKRDATQAAASKAALSDFLVEYAKSGRAACRGCEIKIMKDEIRISKKVYDTKIGMRFGGQDTWHHVSCFAKLRSELQYFEGGNKLPGFKSLSEEDQAEVKKQIPPIKQEDVPEIKKPKTEDEPDSSTDKDKEMKEQNKVIFKYRDELSALKKPELIMLLESNDQKVPPGFDSLLDRLSDIMTFGALLPCKKCKGGQLVFHKTGYICTGDLTEWTKCTNFVKEPERKKFIVPKELKKKYPFLKEYKFKKMVRIVKDGMPPSTIVKKEEKKEEGEHMPKIQREKPPLYDMEIVLLGNLSKSKDELKKQVTKLGGKVVTEIKETVMAVISTPEDVEKMTSRVREAQDADIHVVSEDFLDEAKDYVGRIPELVQKKSICTWGSDPNNRLPAEKSKDTKSKSRSIFTKSVPSKMKFKVVGGTAVDPDSGLENLAHVYQKDGVKFTVILGETNIQKGRNSYYKLQLLEADNGNTHWVFRSWGRIGTSIGGTKLENLSLFEAKKQFEFLYYDKTGNQWSEKDNFTKVPGKMYPIDIDYGDDDNLQLNKDLPSNLPKPVEQLMHLIFDLNAMKQVMMEFELDLEKMPLGKLSKRQLQDAYSVLTELQGLVDLKSEQERIIDATNRFYTLVPHSFGVDNPPIIDDTEDIKKKLEMLESLIEMEIAYSLMKESSSKGGNPADAQYAQLKVDIEPLDRETEEFKIIEEYVHKTHAPTHTGYEMEISQAFVVRRHGEDKRYEPFKKLHNRKLLWHGSRITNFGGILSQGLRIAPPEAPVTGYMFGKGIYFADMVSKSANYCFTSSSTPTGLMLLCEVALGEMYERTRADYIKKLPKGKHSTKGVGRTQPDSNEYKKLHDDVEVPCGKPVTYSHIMSDLLYNEYIVYDVAQVNTKYLLQMNFKFKY